MRLLLLGGGHAHAVVLRDFRGADTTLVTPFPHHTYSGMVPGFVAGHYRLDEIRIDLARLAARAGVKLVIGRVAALDAARRLARLEDGTQLQYDVASLNLGSIPASAPGSAQHALAAKPFENFMERWLEAKDRVRKVGVVGAGAAGVEIAMAVAYRAAAKVTLYSDRPAVGRRVARALERNGVTLRSNTPVTAVQPGPAVLTGGTRESFDLVIWTAGAAPLPWLRDSGLDTDAQGFVLVDDKLRSVSHPEVFAAGTAPRCAMRRTRSRACTRYGTGKCWHGICAAANCAATHPSAGRWPCSAVARAMRSPTGTAGVPKAPGPGAGRTASTGAGSPASGPRPAPRHDL